YRSGKMLVVVTFDEGNPLKTADGSAACCGERPGPNWPWPGYAPILGLFGIPQPPPGSTAFAGGGKVGAVLLNPKYIRPGTSIRRPPTTTSPRCGAMRTCWGSRRAATMASAISASPARAA